LSYQVSRCGEDLALDVSWALYGLLMQKDYGIDSIECTLGDVFDMSWALYSLLIQKAYGIDSIECTLGGVLDMSWALCSLFVKKEYGIECTLGDMLT
jgi:hypothetical protein